ncbi:MAG: GGDEF domain-containing protein [Clostridiales bacterium]|nr:GGDEF domain-containing protein [Clostridiales bacterium]
MGRGKDKFESFFSNEKILEIIRLYSNDTIYFKDVQSRFIWNNRAHAAQFGISDPHEMVGKTDADYFPKDFATRARKEELEIMDTRIPLISNIERLEKADGSVVWYSASKYPLIDNADNVIGTWGISRNITALKIVEEELSRTNEKLKRLSQVDDLTGLFNRRYFYEMIEKTAYQYDRRNSPDQLKDPKNTFCLISLDIDFFKKINDDYGHNKGDDVLRLVAGILTSQCRKSDMVFRIGGDEFMMLLPDTPLKGAKVQAERVRSALSAAPIVLDDNSAPVRLTASMGISCYKDCTSVSDLIHKADERLYTSKNLGRDRAT